VEKRLLEELKSLFFDWCSHLTIDEVVSNESLMSAIEEMERLLVAAIDH
jgi:hypothetical protein